MRGNDRLLARPTATPMPQTPNTISILGFIGLGVMGEPMRGHLARRAGKPILAFDLRPEPLERLVSNAVTAASVAQNRDAAIFPPIRARP
jgi:hypothetical protein